MGMNLKLSASPNGTRNVFDRTVDYVADYGAVAGGSAATNNAALSAFNTAYAGFTGHTRLTIPAGTYAHSGDQWWGRLGGDRLTIAAPGVTISGISGFAKIALVDDDQHHANIATVSAGASTVSLITSAQTSRFSVGQGVIITEGDMQGYGSPPNPWKFEFNRVASIGTGELTFTEPLANSYSSTIPNYAPGSAFQPYLGGPATVYALSDAWDQEIEMQGVTVPDMGGLFYGKTRVAKYTDCTFATYGPCPTMNVLFRSLRCTGAGTGGLEIDKCVHRIEFINSMHRAVDFQSASINELYVENMVQTGSSLRWRGGARNSNTFINLQTTTFNFGVMNYGCMGPTTMTDCSASTGTFFNQTTPFSDMTEEGGGVLSYDGGPNAPSNLFHYWAVPGGNAVLLDSSNNFARSFQISDVSQSGGRTYVTTNLPDPVPSTINGRSAPWKIIAHPCPDLTMVNCSGNSLFTTHSGLPAGTPFNSWTL